MPFWSEDERQVYLIGLRSFARGEWPYFGADVVWNGSQLPGALQALLVRWALAIWPAPEAPIILLNLLSFAALCGFAWFLIRRFPDVPRWIIAGLLFTCPWTLNFSAHIINTSYVLPGAIVFFVGFFEGMPAFRRGLLPVSTAWACLGFGLLWVMQIHMSWVVLPAFVIAAAIGVLIDRVDPPGKTRRIGQALIGFVAGAALPAGLLVPTLMKYGLASIGLTGAITLQPQSPVDLLTTAARVLSFASFELMRFLGLTRADRVFAIWRQPWIAPFVALVLIAGIVQPIWMLVTAFRKAQVDASDWRRIRVLVGATIVLIYSSYFLSIRGQQAHAFYLAFPISAMFALSCWQLAARAASGDRRRRWERLAAVVIVSNVIVHVGLAIDRRPRQSLYANRALAAAAIADRNDRYMGDRRDTIYEKENHRPRPTDPVTDPDAYLAASPTSDLEVQQVTWTPLRDYASGFTITIAHRGTLAAWCDLRYESTYYDDTGQVFETHEGVIKQIIQPGETRTWEVPDGNRPDLVSSLKVKITTAERVIPRK